MLRALPSPPIAFSMMNIKRVIEELNQLELDGVIETYAIGGAVAAQAYTEPTSTMDVDAFVILKHPNPGQIIQMGPIYDHLMRRGATVDGSHLVIGGWPLQVLLPGDSLQEEAVASARKMPMDGQSAKVMAPEHLAAIALKLGRPKDKLRVTELIKSKAFDQQFFDALVVRHGLTQAWATFRIQFLDQS